MFPANHPISVDIATHAWEKDLLATCTAKMAGKVTVGIEDEGKLASTRILEMGLRSNKKSKAAAFAIASTRSMQKHPHANLVEALFHRQY
ncbi:hypothetical protein GQ457_07G001150 [Hibiscus cannabinus]